MATSTFEKLSETRQVEILDASAAVFARKGYFQAGIAEICQAAGMSNGAMYKYFQNKKGLYIAVGQRTVFLLREQASAVATGNDSMWTHLQKIFDAVPPFLARHMDYWVVYMDMGSPSMGELARELSNTFEKWSFDYFYQMARTAMARGEIRPSLSAEAAAYFIDNHLLLFTFSCVSEHYDRRFNQFFGKGAGRLDHREKTDSVMASFRQFLT